MTKAFCGCGKEISPKTKSGRCMRCAAADPAVRAKKGAKTPEQRAARSEAAKRLNADRAVIDKRNTTLAIRNADPAFKARHAEACRQAKLRMMANPEYVEKLRESGRTLGRINLQRGNEPEVRARARISIKRRALAWCPEEHWSLNAELKRAGILLAECKRIILEQVPGTPEHARRTVASNALSMQFKHAREVGSRY